MKISNSSWPIESESKEGKFFIPAAITIIVAVFALFYIFFLRPSLDGIHEMDSTIKARQKAIVELANNTEKAMEDSCLTQTEKIQYLANKVVFLEQHYGNVLNDLRQETNNHLEYINTWLGIWIAILSLVCGVGPALIQYRLYIINRRKLRDELEIFEQTIGCHEITNYVNSVIQCMDSQIIADSTHSRDLISILLYKTTDSFDKLLNILNKENRSRIQISQINALVLSLVQLSGMLDRVKVRVDDKYIGKLTSITTRIRNEILRLTGIEESGSDTLIFKNLFSILNELRTLSIEWDYKED